MPPQHEGATYAGQVTNSGAEHGQGHHPGGAVLGTGAFSGVVRKWQVPSLNSAVTGSPSNAGTGPRPTRYPDLDGGHVVVVQGDLASGLPRGHTVTVDSRGAHDGEPDVPTYGARKGAEHSMTQSFAFALARLGTCCVGIAPGSSLPT